MQLNKKNPLTITSWHHVAIICQDYLTSKYFYVNILGFEVLAEQFREERQSWKLDLAIPGGGQIELFSFPIAPARPTQPEALGLRHLAFGVTSVQAARQYLEAQGVTCEPIRSDDVTGKHFMFFRDPDGLPLELYAL